MRTRIVTFIAASLVASNISAAELGQKVVFDAAKVPASKWRTENGISVAIEDNTLVLRSGNVDYGWATTEDRFPVVATAVIDLEVKKAVNGQLNAQIEWLSGEGKFLAATNILQQAKEGAKLTQQKLASFLPKEGTPRKFGLKFWIEGKNAEVRLSPATIHFAKSWRKPGTRLVNAYNAKAKVTADNGMAVKADGETLVAKLEAGTPYSAFVLEDRVAFDPKAVVMLDLDTLQRGVLTLQALCWNGDGTFLKAVDLAKDVAEAGVFEFPLDLVKEQLPADTAKLSFKVWLAGKETSSRITGLYYGIGP